MDLETENGGTAATAASRKPIVAIVGRQNVGKSTLLNRLAGRRISIVADLPGTTRDRVAADVDSYGGDRFRLVDTGGLEIEPDSAVGRGVREQVQLAVAEADVVLLMTDVMDGLTPPDLEAAEVVRRAGKPALVVASKADNARLELHALEFHGLGLGEPVAVSAYHGRGIDDLLDRIGAILPPMPPPEADTGAMKVAIVGRPNVGKSMLLNAILRDERSIVDEKPGTTRDALDTTLDFGGQNVLLIDTAGMRRRGRLEAGIERYSVMRAMRAIDRADVALVVMDATELPTAQDMHVVGFVQQAAKGIVLVVSKWDLMAGQDTAGWDRYIRGQFRFVPYAPVLYTSALTGQGVETILPCAATVYGERQKRVPTSQVSSVIHQAVAAHGLPRKGRRQLKVLHATQADVNPPTFVFFVNDARLVHFSYRRYLENRLRQSFGFGGTPLRLVFKSRGER